MSERQASESLAPWETPNGRNLLSSLQGWRQMRRLIEGTLRLEGTERAHEVRAAASMVIMFCRDGFWPVEDEAEMQRLLGLAARQLTHVKQLYETKGRIRPELQSSRSFRRLLTSIDEEIRILEARMEDPPPPMPNEPPCTWGRFWD